MDDPSATTQFAAEGTTWELRVSDPDWAGATPRIEYELVRLNGDAYLNDFDVRLTNGGGGELYDNDRYIPLSAGVPARGVLYAPADAEVVSVSVFGFQEGGDTLPIMEISGIEVPDRPEIQFGLVDAPITFPSWAAPMGDETGLIPPGEPEDWTEATIVSASASPAGIGRIEYEIEVESRAVVGEPREITRELDIYGSTSPSRSGLVDSDDATVTISPGETVTVRGTLGDGGRLGPDGAYRVRVTNPDRTPPTLDWDASPDPFALAPQETIQIPEPVNADKLMDDASLMRAAVEAPVGGYNYYAGSGNMVNDERFITALLDYRAGNIDDLQMARLHALYLEGRAKDFSPADQEIESEGSPVLVGMDESGTVQIRNVRERTPDLFGAGPLFRYDDTDFSFPRGSTAGKDYGRQAVTGLIPGFEYTFGFDEQIVTGYEDPAGGLTLVRESGGVDVEEPDPPSVSVECTTGSTTITAGDRVTITATARAASGNTSTDATVRFAVAGETVDQTVTLGPNSSTAVEATFEITEPGEYTPEVTVV